MSGLPRGIRNNNPGNLIRTSIKWQGMAESQTDSRFIVFKEMKYGVRAMLLLLVNKYKKGQKSIRELITSWAPAHENNTGQYIQYVSGRVGVDPDYQFALTKPVLQKLAGAIMETENGKAYKLTGEQFESGFNLLPSGILKTLGKVVVSVLPLVLLSALIYKSLA